MLLIICLEYTRGDGVKSQKGQLLVFEASASCEISAWSPDKGSFLPLRGNEPLLQPQGIHGIWRFKVVKHIHTDVPI